MWESCLSGSMRGRRATEGMEKILWHRRESRRKTEKTNIFLQPREAPAYSKRKQHHYSTFNPPKADSMFDVRSSVLIARY